MNLLDQRPKTLLQTLADGRRTDLGRLWRRRFQRLHFPSATSAATASTTAPATAPTKPPAPSDAVNQAPVANPGAALTAKTGTTVTLDGEKRPVPTPTATSSTSPGAS